MPPIVLYTEQLSKSFGDIKAVDSLSLQVHEGEILGFLGPNGAGKTTAISMMCGLLKPDAGHVFFRGKPIEGMRSLVGVCPQENILWEKLTALEQLEFIGSLYGMQPKSARQRGAMLLEELGLSNKANQLAGKLSGGMKRRLNLALALVHDPEILFLDEPESGLDPQSRVLVREYIRSLAKGKTIILTTHNMDEAERLVDRVAIIDHGRLLVIDTPQALKRSVGEGDVLEVDVADSSDAPGPSNRAATIAVEFYPDSFMVERTLTVRGRGVIEKLAEMLHALRQSDVQVCDIRLRSCTLEDVFLSLTGRRLRE